MRHRRLFVGSMVSIPIGIILLILGNIIAPFGVQDHASGFWIFTTIHSEATGAYYLGFALAVIGLVTIIGGISGIIISIVLEILDKYIYTPQV
ncbi:MAG: hypothetical protein OEY83_05895 [Candidatus Bathyarchaeota archaeon]|nr:hypothetical protein [Candidatus Bathyarchaeota archaeon]